MPLNLPYGYIRPSTGDKGSAFFPTLEAFLARIASHTHNGTDSAPVAAQSAVSGGTISSWTSIGNGQYQATVTMPGATVFGNFVPAFKISGGADDGQVVFPKVLRVDDFHFTVTVNDPTLTLAVFLTS